MVRLPVERAVEGADIPGDRLLRRWARAAITAARPKREVTLGIRLVGATEGKALNARYRNRAYATNVLSFPCDMRLPGSGWLGDVVICAPVVRSEAIEQGKSFRDHCAHMVVHGVLHLLGHDHIKSREAVKMEALEVRILQQLGCANPYNTQ